MQFHLDCVVQRYSRRSRAYDWNLQSFDRVVQCQFVQDTPVRNSGEITGEGILLSGVVCHEARRSSVLIGIILVIRRHNPWHVFWTLNGCKLACKNKVVL